MTALESLAELLRADDTVISPHVVDGAARPVLGELVAAGPRAAGNEDDYALIAEAVREGYLLHYGSPRIVKGADADLALLAGDYLYATGLERLAALEDPDAVTELSDLISISAQVHAGSGSAGTDTELAAALWLASAVAVAVGRSDDHEQAKQAAREGSAGAATALWQSAHNAAAQNSIGAELEAARETIGFAAHDRG
jgi:hypothetical protein